MTTKQTLHLYRDDEGNVYAARDIAHAKALWAKDTGEDSDDWGVEWRSIPDEKFLVVADEDGEPRRLRASDWANETGAPGCVGGANH